MFISGYDVPRISSEFDPPSVLSQAEESRGYFLSPKNAFDAVVVCEYSWTVWSCGWTG